MLAMADGGRAFRERRRARDKSVNKNADEDDYAVSPDET